MKIKKGDNIIMISGKDRGKKSKVLHVLPKTGRVIVEGVALKKKHQRPKKSGQKGQVVSLPSAVDISNMMLLCKNCDKGSRAGYVLRDGKKVRICRKCKNNI